MCQTSRQSGNFWLLQTLRPDTKTKRTKRRFITRRTTDGKSQAVRKHTCTVEVLRMRRSWATLTRNSATKCRSTATRSEDMQKWDEFAVAPTQCQPTTKEQRERVPKRGDWHKQTHQSHPIQPRFQVETKVYRVTEVARWTQQGEIRRTDAIAKLLVTFKQVMHNITNLAMNKLRLVTKLVELGSLR